MELDFILAVWTVHALVAQHRPNASNVFLGWVLLCVLTHWYFSIRSSRLLASGDDCAAVSASSKLRSTAFSRDSIEFGACELLRAS